MELRDILLQEAREKGICTDGFRQIHELDKEGMIDYYISIIDWGIERNFPSIDVLREHFSDALKNGVFVDRDFSGETISGLQAYVFHNCTGTINVAADYENSTIPMLYFANGCNMEVTCKQEENKGNPIRVPIYTFGENEVKSLDNEFVIFKVYKNNIIS